MFRIRAYLTNASLAGFDLAIAALCYRVTRGFHPMTGLSLSRGTPVSMAGEFLGVGEVLLIWLLCSLYLGLYRSRRLDSPFADTRILIKIGFIAGLLLEAAAHGHTTFVPDQFFPSRFAILNTIVLCASRAAVRVVLRELRRRGWNVKRLVLVSTPELNGKVAGKFNPHSPYGYQVIDHLLYRNTLEGKASLRGEFRECLGASRIDDVILALPFHAYDLAAELIYECECRGINVRIIPDLLPLVQSETQVYDLGGLPLVNVRPYPTEYFRYAVLKRCLDVAVSVFVLVFLSPVLFVIAALVKLTSSGPVLFAQERVGLNGRRFRMLKFRTMTSRPESDSASHWTVPGDPHVTFVGRWLRRSNLDELPQFLNVLMGHMSIVGPRPERPFFLERFRREVPDYMARHYVKSGITGWAQVNGWRGDTSIPERVAHDLYYIRNWAMGFDFKIMFLTLTRTFFHRNAY